MSASETRRYYLPKVLKRARRGPARWFAPCVANGVAILLPLGQISTEGVTHHHVRCTACKRGTWVLASTALNKGQKSCRMTPRCTGKYQSPKQGS